MPSKEIVDDLKDIVKLNTEKIPVNNRKKIKHDVIRYDTKTFGVGWLAYFDSYDQSHFSVAMIWKTF